MCDVDQKVVTGDKLSAFKNIINSGGYVFALFYNPSCGHCKRFLPVFLQYRNSCKRNNSQNVKMLAINYETAPELFEENKIMSYPQTFVFKDGKKIHTIEGADVDELKDYMARVGLSI